MILRFAIFILFFTSTFGGLHLYLFFKVKNAFQLCGLYRNLFIVFLVLMSFSPVLVRVLERSGPAFLSRIFAYTGYIWMGALLFLVSLFFVTDLYRWLSALGMLIFRPAAPWPVLPQPATAFVVIGVSLLGILYGLWEANRFTVERVTVPAPQLARPLTIAQISDVHLGQLVGKRKTETYLKLVRDCRPDLFVCTGDLVDEDMSGCAHLEELFRNVEAPLGKYAVTGNHEMFAGLDQAVAFMERCGFVVLRGTSVPVGDDLLIAGVDDRAGQQMGYMKNIPTDREVLEGLPRDRFILFLKHTPWLKSVDEGLFNLMLSGHTHRGQILPFALFTRLAFKYHAGLYTAPAGSRVYVSRGTGTWGPPVRVCAPPEVTIITLQP